MRGIRGLRGVTLIELAVVMAIIAIMGLFLAPAIGEWVDNYRIRQSARDISSTLQLARMQTISTRTTHTVTFNPGNDTYLLSPGGSDMRVARGVDIVSANPISFNPDGTASSTGTITIKNTQGKQYQIVVIATGRIQIQ